jgi:hypothetical protein
MARRFPPMAAANVGLCAVYGCYDVYLKSVIPHVLSSGSSSQNCEDKSGFTTWLPGGKKLVWAMDPLTHR